MIALRFVEGTAHQLDLHWKNCRQFEPPGSMIQLLRIGDLEDRFYSRTFVRTEPRPIHRKWVYVWRAKDARGGGLELVDELWFEEGKLKRVPLSGKGSQRGKDVRAPAGPFLTELPVLAGSIDEPTTWYFFLLAPMQYPWDILERIAPEVPARGMRFPDPFWADLLMGDAPGTKQGRSKPVRAVPANPRAIDFRQARFLVDAGAPVVGAQVYLFDPLGDAEEKALTVSKRLDEWYAEIRRLNEDDRYTLAKRISALVKGQPKLANEIRVADLDREIEQSERKVVAAEEAVDKAVHRLTQWLGFQMRLHPKGEVIATETCAPVPAPPPASDERFNPFSKMLGDFAGREIPPELDRAVITVYGRLGECRIGRFWMRFVWDAAERGDRDSRVADGGLSLLLKARPPSGEPAAAAAPEAGAGAAEQDRGEGDGREAHRKSGSVLSAGVGFLCEQFAPLWDEKHLREVFRKFGIELEPVPKGTRAQRLGAAERIAAEGREVLAEANVGARLRPRSAAAVQALGKFAPWLQLALEANNTARGLAALRDGKLGVYEALSATGNVNDSLAALNDVAKLFRPASTGLARATPVFAIVGGTLDTVTGAMDASNAYEENGWTGRTGGHTLRSAGGALAVVGGILMIANPVGLAGAVVILVGVAAQFAGSWVVDASSELRQLLRESPWGRIGKPIIPSGASVEPNPHHALSRAIYRFTAQLVAADRAGLARARGLSLRIELKEDVARWLPDTATWTVEARGVYGTAAVWKGWTLERRTVSSNGARSAVVVEVPVPAVVLGPTDDMVRVDSAEIVLAPCADDRHRVTKRLSQHEFDPFPLFGRGSSTLAR
jgi:hypothetical protein